MLCQSESRCAYRELNPAVLMIKSAEDRLSSELAEPLDRPMARGFLTQRQMRSELVVVAGVAARIRRRWRRAKKLNQPRRHHAASR